jgi:hypothetical protein
LPEVKQVHPFTTSAGVFSVEISLGCIHVGA